MFNTIDNIVISASIQKISQITAFFITLGLKSRILCLEMYKHFL